VNGGLALSLEDEVGIGELRVDEGGEVVLIEALADVDAAVSLQRNEIKYQQSLSDNGNNGEEYVASGDVVGAVVANEVALANGGAGARGDDVGVEGVDAANLHLNIVRLVTLLVPDLHNLTSGRLLKVHVVAEGTGSRRGR